MAIENQKQHITIDIVSDVMCPWCHIGRKRLNDALDELGDDVEATVQWLPYQLDATLPKEGKDRKQYFIDKFGSLDAHEQIYAPINEAGKAEEIPFRLNDIAVSPNTLDAHRLIFWAGRDHGSDVQNKLVNILMQFYFEQGKHIGDDDVLVEAAELAGMPAEKIRYMLASDDSKDVVQNQIETIKSSGVSGVPVFILNKKYALEGAQKKDVIKDTIQEVIKMNESE